MHVTCIYSLKFHVAAEVLRCAYESPRLESSMEASRSLIVSSALVTQYYITLFVARINPLLDAVAALQGR